MYNSAAIQPAADFFFSLQFQNGMKSPCGQREFRTKLESQSRHDKDDYESRLDEIKATKHS